MKAPIVVVVTAAVMAMASSVRAQTLNDVVSFLFTNRSIPTDDFARDRQAADATRDAFSKLLVANITTLPISSSAAGFAYRLDPQLGVATRPSTSFGPWLTERVIGAGRRHLSVGVTYQQAAFGSLDGRSLTDGTLVSTASRLRGTTTPFDSETVTLDVQADTMSLLGEYGITDNLDVGVAVPIVRVTVHGERVDDYRGQRVTQAVASGVARGTGDVLLRVKQRLVGQNADGLALGAEIKLPTGDEQNLLGTGQTTVTPRLIGSLERERVGVHGNFGLIVGNDSRSFEYRGAVTATALTRLTLIGEVAASQLQSSGHLTTVVTPHPTLTDVETVRLVAASGNAQRVLAAAGVKWNAARSLVINAQMLHPITDTGLNAKWVPAFTVDYAFQP